jgi:pre-mRNA-splicing factor ATP-dependent RNA helicase DHX15/PRP43
VGRLLEYAANYFDLSTFPDGESKNALKRIANKRAGKAGRRDEANGDESAKKKRKKG